MLILVISLDKKEFIEHYRAYPTKNWQLSPVLLKFFYCKPNVTKQQLSVCKVDH